jgi:FG-GAP-like repeat/FG-GAP repeat
MSTMQGRRRCNVALLGALLISGCIEARTYKPVIPPAPTVPQPRIPQNNAYTGSIHSPRPGALQPRFTWTASTTEVKDPIVYELQLSPSRDFGADALTFQTQELAHQPPDALPVSRTPPVGRRYFWRVRACLPLICSNYSAIRWINLGRSDHDYNGDGYADVLVGAPDNGQNGREAGRAYVYFGGPGPTFDTAPDGLLAPSTAFEHFGESIDSAGDFDGDGFADVLVGAPEDDSSGRASLYFGGAGTAFDSTPDLIFKETASDRRFGASVSTAGDFNGDGFADLIIGSPDQLVNPAPGGVFLYFGNAERTKPDGIKLAPSANPNHVGDFVTLLGDLNNDGLSDVAVGDASIIPNQTSCISSLYLGRTDLKANQAPDDRLTGRLAGCKLTMKAAGDVNGDGFSDLLKAVGESGLGDFFGAEVTLLLGSALPTFPSGEILLATNAHSVAALKDINGDGFDDFALGKTATSVLVDIYSGAARIEVPLRPTLSYNGPQGLFGYSLTGVGDMNGDGLGDIAIGDPGLSSNRGAVSIYFGVEGAVDVNVDGFLDAGYPEANFGRAVASVVNKCSPLRATRI